MSTNRHQQRALLRRHRVNLRLFHWRWWALHRAQENEAVSPQYQHTSTNATPVISDHRSRCKPALYCTYAARAIWSRLSDGLKSALSRGLPENISFVCTKGKASWWGTVRRTGYVRFFQCSVEHRVKGHCGYLPRSSCPCSVAHVKSYKLGAAKRDQVTCRFARSRLRGPNECGRRSEKSVKFLSRQACLRREMWPANLLLLLVRWNIVGNDHRVPQLWRWTLPPLLQPIEPSPSQIVQRE